MVFNVLYQTLSEVLKIFNKYDCFYDLVIDTLEWVLVYPHCKFEQMRVRILMAFYEMFIIRIRVIRTRTNFWLLLHNGDILVTSSESKDEP